MIFATDCLATTGPNLGGLGLALALIIGVGVALLVVGRSLRSKITVFVLLALGLTLGGLGGVAGMSTTPAHAVSNACGTASSPAPSDSSSAAPQEHVTIHFLGDEANYNANDVAHVLSGNVRFCEGISTTTNCVTVPAGAAPGSEVTLPLTSSPARINVSRSGPSCQIYAWNSQPSWFDADLGNGFNEVLDEAGTLFTHNYSAGDTIYWVNFDFCLT